MRRKKRNELAFAVRDKYGDNFEEESSSSESEDDDGRVEGENDRRMQRNCAFFPLVGNYDEK